MNRRSTAASRKAVMLAGLILLLGTVVLLRMGSSDEAPIDPTAESEAEHAPLSGKASASAFSPRPSGLPPSYRQAADVPFQQKKRSRQARILGRVEDMERKPIPGAHVALFKTWNLGSEPRFLNLLEEANAAQDGSFEIRLEEFSSGWLVVNKPGFAEAAEVINTRRSPLIRRVFVLRKAASRVFGRIVEQGSGAPIPGATVSLVFLGPAKIAQHQVATDFSGEFEISKVAIGEPFHIAANSPRHLWDWFRLELDPDAREKRVNFTLKRGRAIELRISHSDGAPAVDAAVRRWGSMVSSLTDEDGKAAQIADPDLNEEQYVILPRKRGVEKAANSRTVKIDTRVKHHEIVLEAMPMLRGRIRDSAGRPLPQASVLVSPETTASGRPRFGFSGRGRSQEDGSFSVPLLMTELQAVRVVHPDYLSRDLEYPTGTKLEDVPYLEVILEEGDAGVYGWVFDSHGKPADSFGVRAIRRDADTSRSQSLYRPFVESNGWFMIEGLAQGTYDLQVNNLESDPAFLEEGRLEAIELRGRLLYGELLIHLSPAKRIGETR